MTTTFEYKTLTFTQTTLHNSNTFSKAESVYSPNLFDERIVNLAKPSATLVEIDQTIFEEKIIRSTKKSTPVLYSAVWFLN